MTKKASLTGLTQTEVERRLRRFGPNELQKQRQFPGVKLLFSQFKSPLVYILVLAGLVTLFLGEYADSLVIFAAVFLNTVLGFYQEQKAQKTLAALRSLLAPKAKVIREGEQQEIEASQLVPGDLVILTIGTRVPADGVLVEATDLSVNEAILTGESLPVKKKALKRSGGQATEAEKVFMGTTVTTGIGKMLVTQTGMKTEVGKIGKRVGEITEEKTPLQEQLGSLAKVLALVVGGLTLLIFLGGEWLGYDPLQMFITSVAVAVAAIPEGLIVTLTVILALGMQRILKRKAIVRKLLAAETLGSVSVICCDKTGTLTEGKMAVVDSLFADRRPETADLLVKAALLCNDMRDPLEVAMWQWAKRKLKAQNLNVEDLQQQLPRWDEIPFSPKTKRIATLHPGFLFVSGAPEVILASCRLTKAKRQRWQKEFDQAGQKALRLVGFGYKRVKKSQKKIREEDLKDLEWLGILVYEDPVRKGVKSALDQCRQAGIIVKVITGDYAPTALAVLRQLNFKLDPETEVMEGAALEKISEKELAKQVAKIVLFARTTPEQKLKIVQALKENGEVVAMTGDGVNDAPALKTADIGIVMGEASDVAKESADMVLLDSAFGTIVHAVEEGRTIFENIKKVVLYLLSDSFTEVILIGGSLLLGLPLPLTAAQILWVNLIEDTLPNIALAFEPKEKEVMVEPPRPRNQPILDLEMKTLIFIIGIFTDLVLLILFFFLLKGVFHLHFIRTVIFAALAVDSLFYVFSCRSLRKTIFHEHPFENKLLNWAVLISFLLLLVAIYVPFMQLFLKTHPLGIREWLLVIGLGLFEIVVVEIAKWFFIVKKKTV